MIMTSKQWSAKP